MVASVDTQPLRNLRSEHYALREPHTKIAILTVDFYSPFYGEIIDSICSYLHAQNCYARVQSGKTLIKSLRHYESLSELQCDGLILQADCMTEEQLNALIEKFGNVVVINRRLARYPRQSVYTNNHRGGALAARCLIDNGHKAIAMITGPTRFIETHERAAGFEAELQASGLQPSLVVEGDFTRHSGAKSMERILSLNPHITAVFAQNDEMAFAALNVCRQAGLRVPQDISLIGFDGVAMSNFVTPKLTSIKQPLRQLGERAAYLLHSMIVQGSRAALPHSNEFIPVLAENESVAPPANQAIALTRLTERERECLVWIAQGKTSWEASVILGISESTTTFHLRNAVLKLKASNRTHAVAKALQSGIINLPRL